eukprot:3526651-Amphidinium_carterae.1
MTGTGLGRAKLQGRSLRWLPHSREQATVTLVCSPGEKTIIGQIIFKGRTLRSLPSGPQVANLSVVASESHWASTATLAAL